MSYIEYYRIGCECHQREMWDASDIADHCGISQDKAYKLHLLANKEHGIPGYGEIPKDKFMEFLDDVQALSRSRQLQDEANSSTIRSAGKNFRLTLGSQLIYQALSLLRGLV